jgi:hypothetical protein
LIYLIGTVHRDLKGFNKLKKLLDRIRPDIVTLEMSPVSLAWRRDHGAAMKTKLLGILVKIASDRKQPPEFLRKHPSIAAIFHLIDVPYEYLASWKYAHKSGAPLIMLDDPDAAAGRISVLQSELIAESNIELLLAEEPVPSWQDRVEAKYLSALHFLNGHPRTFSAPLQNSGHQSRQNHQREGITELLNQILADLDHAREKYMGDKIARLATANPEATLVHVGGWEHLITINGYPFLANLLGDLKPEKYLLDDNFSPIA